MDSPEEEGDIMSIRLKCYLGSAVSVVSAKATLSYTELLTLLSSAFHQPVTISQYEDSDGSRKNASQMFWESGEAAKLYNTLLESNDGSSSRVSLILFLSSDTVVMLQSQPFFSASASPETGNVFPTTSTPKLLDILNGNGASDFEDDETDENEDEPPLRTPPPSPPMDMRDDTQSNFYGVAEWMMEDSSESESGSGSESSNTTSGSSSTSESSDVEKLVSQPSNLRTNSVVYSKHSISSSSSSSVSVTDQRMPKDDDESEEKHHHQQEGDDEAPPLRTPPSSPPELSKSLEEPGVMTRQKKERSFRSRRNDRFDLSVSGEIHQNTPQTTGRASLDGVPHVSESTPTHKKHLRLLAESMKEVTDDEFDPVFSRLLHSSRDNSPHSSEPSPPNLTPSHWSKVKRLGRGAFGGVFLAIDRNTGDLFAVKQQELMEGNDYQVRKLLEQYSTEIEVMKSLKNEHVVKYFGANVEDGTMNIFMEYVGGGSLSANLALLGSFNENMIRVYARQILEGLAYLHQNNILHRDIKGANILIDTSKDGKAVLKLTDFGCSRKIQASLMENKVLSFQGTPYFVAPEVVQGIPYNSAADIYSFGCTLIEMATGRPPLSKEFPDPAQALYHIHQGGNVVIPGNLSPELKDLMSICLQRDPSKRKTAAELLNHPFFSSEDTDDHDGTTHNNGSGEEVHDEEKTTISIDSTATTHKGTLFDLDQFPPEIVARIFSELPLKDLASCSLVCKNWCNMVRDPTVMQSVLPRHINVSEHISFSSSSTSTRYGVMRKLLLEAQHRRDVWNELIDLPPQSIRAHDKGVTAVLCLRRVDHSDFPFIVTAGEDKRIRIWNVEPGRCVETSKKHSGVVTGLAPLPVSMSTAKHGRLFISGSTDGIHFWGTRSQKSIGIIKCKQPIKSLCTNKQIIFSLCEESDTIVAYDAISRNVLGSFSLGKNVPSSPLVSSGSFLAIGLSNGSVALWDLRLSRSTTCFVLKAPDCWSPVISVRLNLQLGVLYGSTSDSSIFRWNVITKQCDKTFRERQELGCTSLWFDISSLFTIGKDGPVKLWDISAFRPQAELSVAPDSHLTCLDCFQSITHSVVCAGSSDRMLYVWFVTKTWRDARQPTPPVSPFADSDKKVRNKRNEATSKNLRKERRKSTNTRKGCEIDGQTPRKRDGSLPPLFFSQHRSSSDRKVLKGSQSSFLQGSSPSPLSSPPSSLKSSSSSIDGNSKGQQQPHSARNTSSTSNTDNAQHNNQVSSSTPSSPSGSFKGFFSWLTQSVKGKPK